VVTRCADVYRQCNAVARHFHPYVVEVSGESARVVADDSHGSTVLSVRVRRLPPVHDCHPRLGERDADKAAHADDGHARDRLLVYLILITVSIIITFNNKV